ncbi:DNA polymerase III subunit beta [Paenibacillus sp. MMO-177]|uniref:DNA polymerase III subunit beta n=1 Tax=Paenibacillus sp. MMO-177 TaxID=3081289 RepID=UPI0030199F3A
MVATKMREINENKGGGQAKGKTSFQIEKDTLLDALLFCAKIVPRVASIPLLSCIKLDIQKDTLFVTAMDVEQSALQFLKINNVGGVNGSYLLPAKEGIDLVKKMPAGEITFNQNDNMVEITYGSRGKAQLVVLSAEEYPALPKPADIQFVATPIETLRKGALASRFASTDDKRPTLTAVYIYSDQGQLAFMGTDSHRVYRHISKVKIDDPALFHNAMIPAVRFKSIVDSLKSEKVDLAIDQQTSHVVLRDQNVIYFGRMLDGTYPELSKFFVKKDEGPAVTVSRGELDDTLNRMLSLDGVDNNRVTLEVNEDSEFTIHSRSQKGEICEGFPDAKVDEGFPTIKFNARYLKEALLVGDREVKTATLRVMGVTYPGYIEFDGDQSVCVVVNQVR